MSVRAFQHHKQQGVTLIVVLVMLLVVTILGIAGARIAMLGERATRYDRDFQVAMQGAEAALMDAEFDIRGPNVDSASRVAAFNDSDTSGFVPDCGDSGATRGLCAGSLDGPVWRKAGLFTGPKAVPLGTFTGRNFDSGTTGVAPARKPSYVIEFVEDSRGGLKVNNGSLIYRITAVGFGPRENVQVMLQTSFKKEMK